MPGPGQFDLVRDETLTKQHSVRLTNLSPYTTYAVTVSSTDGAGNGPALSDPFELQTLAVPDNPPPVFVSGPDSCLVTDRIIQICFKTDIPSSAVVRFGLSGLPRDRSVAIANLRQRHAIPVVGLDADTSYDFEIVLTDSQGNSSSSEIFAVTTDSIGGADDFILTEPAAVSYTSNNTSVVTWKSNLACAATVSYGVGGLTDTSQTGFYAQDQSVVLSGLTPDQTYEFEASCLDVNGVRHIVVPSVHSLGDVK